MLSGEQSGAGVLCFPRHTAPAEARKGRRAPSATTPGHQARTRDSPSVQSDSGTPSPRLGEMSEGMISAPTCTSARCLCVVHNLKHRVWLKVSREGRSQNVVSRCNRVVTQLAPEGINTAVPSYKSCKAGGS